MEDICQGPVFLIQLPRVTLSQPWTGPKTSAELTPALRSTWEISVWGRQALPFSGSCMDHHLLPGRGGGRSEAFAQSIELYQE